MFGYNANTMLIGEYRHNLDPKKRLSIPSKFRKELGDGGVVTRGLDNCLFVFPLKYWLDLQDRLRKLSLVQEDTRAFYRLMVSAASEVEFDSLGRILIPDSLKEFAGLKKIVVVAGLLDRIEIWDESRWNAYRSNLEKNSNKIAKKLGDLGVI